jgi:hypothetical protein
MSQYDFGTIDPYVTVGVELADMLNQWRDAQYTQQRGNARPAFATPGMQWVSDAFGAAAWVINFYSGATMGDVGLFHVDTTAGVAALAPNVMANTVGVATDASPLVATTAFVQAAIAAGIAGAVATLLPPGTVVDLVGSISVAPAGWVIAMQGTIGSSTSGATIRANADCANLYAHLWNGLPNTYAPVTGGRGASASADFAANKPIGGLDHRGFVRATRDDLGGTAANRMPGWVAGFNGGEVEVTLGLGHVPDHTHSAPAGLDPAATYAPRGVYGDGTGVSNYSTVGMDGYPGQTPLPLVQPTRAAGSTIIKL